MSQTSRPHLWVVTFHLGQPHHVWLRRQLERISGFDITVICWQDVRPPGSRDNDPWTVHELGYPINDTTRRERYVGLARRLHLKNRHSAVGAELRALMDLAEQRPPDVMLCHFAYAAMRVQPVSEKLGIPLVTHYHGRDLSRLLKDPQYLRSLRATLPGFAGHVAVGSHQVGWLRDQGVAPERLHLIPCGVPSREFSPAEQGRSEGPVVFASVGRIVRQKGLHIALEAFAKAYPSLPGARYSIIGQGGGEEAVLHGIVARHGLEDAVTFTGSLPSEQVRAALAAADVFVLPVIEIGGEVEGFGVSIAEAAAMALPVIVSRSGGIPDQVIDGQTGRICPQGDVDAVSAAMVELGQNRELRHRMGAAGRANIEANFDTDGQVRKLEAVLRAAVSR